MRFNLVKFGATAMGAVAATISLAGTFAIDTEYSFTQQAGLATYDNSHLNFDCDIPNCNSWMSVTMFTDTTLNTLSGTGITSFWLNWTPAFQGETPPSTAYVSFQVNGNAYGPSGATASITATGGGTLLSALGSQGNWVNLYTTTIAVPIDPLCAESDGSISTPVAVQYDNWASTGGATVGEQLFLTGITTNAPATHCFVKKKKRFVMSLYALRETKRT